MMPGAAVAGASSPLSALSASSSGGHSAASSIAGGRAGTAPSGSLGSFRGERVTLLVFGREKPSSALSGTSAAASRLIGGKGDLSMAAVCVGPKIR